ncbi:hypothetical protein BDV39DRAFT_166002, partial [Aspergillus sergii]
EEHCTVPFFPIWVLASATPGSRPHRCLPMRTMARGWERSFSATPPSPGADQSRFVLVDAHTTSSRVSNETTVCRLRDRSCCRLLVNCWIKLTPSTRPRRVDRANMTSWIGT